MSNMVMVFLLGVISSAFIHYFLYLVRKKDEITSLNSFIIMFLFIQLLIVYGHFIASKVLQHM